MKKIFKVSLALLATLSLSVSCNKEINGIEDDNTITEQQGIPVTITASLSGELTKVALTQDPDNADGAVKLTWATGDKIRVASHADPTKFLELTLSSGAGDKTAEFSGELASGVDAPYDISYNSAGSSYNYAEQTQSADANTAHLKYIATLSGVNAYADVDFTEAWAKAHGNGTFVRSSVLRLRANLPAGVAATVKSVIIRASENWVDGGNQIKVNITTPGDTGSDGIINVYATLPASASTLSADATMEFIFETPEHDYLRQLTKENIGDKTFEMGKVNAIKLNCNTVDTNVFLDDFAGGIGVDGDPWLISNPRQMVKIKDKLKAGETKYFKLIDDIDMAGVSWVSLNNSGSFNKYINLDGDNHTISNLTCNSGSYPSLIGVLYGTVSNLTIDHATISSSASVNQHAGVLAGYIGATNHLSVNCLVSNVTISNSTVSVEGASRRAGGLAAFVSQVEAPAAITISNVTVKTSSVTAKYLNAGGLVAEVTGVATFSDCHVQGTGVTISEQSKNDVSAGGLIGIVSSAATFSGCTVEKASPSTPTSINAPAYVSANSKYVYLGGLVGRVDDVAATFNDCSVSNVSVSLKGTAANNNFRYTGGVMGYIGKSVSVGNTIGCSVISPTISGAVHYTGGFVGYLDGGSIKNCTASSSVTVTGASSVGGFVGMVNSGTLENNTTSLNVSGAGNVGGFAGQTAGGTIKKCSATGIVTATGNNAGGFVGYITNGNLESCTASGNVTGITYVGGLAGTVNGEVNIRKSSAIGNVTAGSTGGGLIGDAKNGADIQNCFAKGNVSGNNRRRGGLIAWIEEGTVSVGNCYASGNLSGTFEIGGLLGLVSVNTLTMTNCAAWNGTIVAGSRLDSNWSSAACVGVTHLTCTLTDNYRNPNMDSLIYWGTNSGCTLNLPNSFQHPDVSASASLTDPNGNAVTSSTMRPYQGKCDATKTLSQLASTTLGWDGSVWDFTGDLPTLK